MFGTTNNFEQNSYGGGFMSPGDATANSPKTTPQRGRSGGYHQSLTPVSIRQLYNATQPIPDDSFRIDDRELHQVKVVGYVLNVNPSTTNVTLTIDDGTGKMEARMWIDPEDNSEFSLNKRNALREGIYVKIVGHMRAFQNKRSIYASHIIPIADYNEVTYHFLEIIYVHLSSTQGTPQNTTVTVTPNTMNYNRFPTANTTTGTSNTHSSSLSDLHQTILQVVRSQGQGTGVSVADIAQIMGVNQAEIRRAVDFLAGEAHLYCTIDEEHFCTTE